MSFVESWKSVALGAAVVAASWAGFGGERGGHDCLTPEQARVLDLLTVVRLDDGQGNALKTLRVDGANLQVVNGTGSTGGDPNGLGNLLIGYNEDTDTNAEQRTGSHMLVVGRDNSYTRYGGLVVGVQNEAAGDWSSAIGSLSRASGQECVSIGFLTQADALYSLALNSVGGVAAGERSVVLGGGGARTEGFESVAIGGRFTRATNTNSVSIGGDNVQATGAFSVAVGGDDNLASGFGSTVTGGRRNTASGFGATVSGGADRTAAGPDDWVAGSLLEDS